ncbi:MAG: hypothetical protein WAQ08_11120 [Aquabacterium sp.]|uniref:hypothetical protein n=1 Tax=Aquabacterium sp. TaxID=1872578 RepID=UPI003BAEA561
MLHVHLPHEADQVVAVGNGLAREIKRVVRGVGRATDAGQPGAVAGLFDQIAGALVAEAAGIAEIRHLGAQQIFQRSLAAENLVALHVIAVSGGGLRHHTGGRWQFGRACHHQEGFVSSIG